MVPELPPMLKASREATKVSYRQLGKSGLRVSVPILGGLSLGSTEFEPWALDEEKVCTITLHGPACTIANSGTGTSPTEGCLRSRPQHRKYPRGLLSAVLISGAVGHGQQLLEWQIRRDHRKGDSDVQHPAAQTGHPHQMLGPRQRARKRVCCSVRGRDARRQGICESIR